MWTKKDDDFLIKNYSKIGSKKVGKILNKNYRTVQKRAYIIGITKGLNVWSKKELIILKENYNKSISELCVLLPQKERKAILLKRRRFGLSPKKMYKWDSNDKNLLKKHWSYSDKELIQKLFPSVKWNSIKEMARRLGLKRLTEYRKGDLSPLLKENNVAYYWMGFIMADGWISKNGQLVVGLSQKDKNHLEKLAKLLKTEIRKINIEETIFFGKKYKREKTVRIAIQDKILGLKLKNKMNISFRKTYNPPDLSFLNTDKKFFSFLAGFIDGDGSITKSKNSIMLRIECHKNWIINFKYIKKRIDDCIFNDIKIKKLKESVLLISCNKSFIINLKDYIFKLNVPILERKWEKIN